MNNLLHGSWSATRWQHTSRGVEGRSLDVVCDLGGNVTLSLGDEAFVLTCNRARRGVLNLGGVFRVEGDTLELQGADAPPQRVRWRLVNDTLTLSSDESSCDFEGNGSEEPATFVSVFVRL